MFWRLRWVYSTFAPDNGGKWVALGPFVLCCVWFARSGSRLARHVVDDSTTNQLAIPGLFRDVQRGCVSLFRTATRAKADNRYIRGRDKRVRIKKLLYGAFPFPPPTPNSAPVTPSKTSSPHSCDPALGNSKKKARHSDPAVLRGHPMSLREAGIISKSKRRRENSWYCQSREREPVLEDHTVHQGVDIHFGKCEISSQQVGGK